jgi:hypothetical protein
MAFETTRNAELAKIECWAMLFVGHIAHRSYGRAASWWAASHRAPSAQITAATLSGTHRVAGPYKSSRETDHR